jgi:hypothetical protein
MTAPAAASTLTRRARLSIETATLALGPAIGHGAQATDGTPWAAAGDRLVVGSAGCTVLATVEVTSVCPGGDVLHVRRVSGELAPGDCRVMRAPVLPLDRRTLAREARLVARRLP